MGKCNRTTLTEERIQGVLSEYFLSQSSKRFEMENLFVFEWESDYLCVTKSGYVYECEIKISRSDFANDLKHKRKKFELLNEAAEGKDKDKSLLPDYFYYVVPEGMISPDEVPAWAGLIHIREIGFPFSKVKEARKICQDNNERTLLNDRLLEKFYYAYRNWKTNSRKVKDELLQTQHLLEETVEHRGGTMGKTIPELEEMYHAVKYSMELLERKCDDLSKDIELETIISRKLIKLCCEKGFENEAKKIIEETEKRYGSI